MNTRIDKNWSTTILILFFHCSLVFFVFCSLVFSSWQSRSCDSQFSFWLLTSFWRILDVRCGLSFLVIQVSGVGICREDLPWDFERPLATAFLMTPKFWISSLLRDLFWRWHSRLCEFNFSVWSLTSFWQMLHAL